MARSTVLSDEVKKLIARVYSEDKTRPATDVLAEVHIRLGRRDWPRISVIQRELKKIRDRETASHQSGLVNLDSPWHLGLLPKFPQVSAEAVTRIFKVEELLNKGVVDSASAHPVVALHLRTALWIARIYDVVEEYWHTTEPAKLLNVAFTYSQHEYICEMLNVPFETIDLDAAIRQGEEQFSKLDAVHGPHTTNESRTKLIILPVMDRGEKRKDGETNERPSIQEKRERQKLDNQSQLGV